MYWHPFIVHFPIVLLALGGLLALLDLLVGGSPGRGASWRCGLAAARDLATFSGGLAALASVVTGDSDASALRVGGPAVRALEAHEQAGSIVVWVALGALAAVAWERAERRRPGGSRPRLARWAARVLQTAALVVVLRAGWLGGRLVHEHGVIAGPGPHRTIVERPPAGFPLESPR